MLLPHPILLRPGFFYTIRIGNFPDNHYYYSKKLDTSLELELESDMFIRFCTIICYDYFGDYETNYLIPFLNFNI